MQHKIYLPLILVLISIIPLLDLLHPGLPITHDGQDHVARIANFYQNLSEGNIIPRWAGNLNWSYGHPILMFLYPLPSYVASVFHLGGFSLIDSTKLVFGIAYILSGLTMYLWISSFLGRAAGFIAGMLYLFAPYRFVDLYVRGAIGEHVAFVFPPLVLYFLLKLSKQPSQKYITGVAFSLGGLILVHNAISLMFLPLIFLYALFLLWQSKDKKLVASCYLLVAILGFGLSAFFWIPAFFEGKYTLRDIVASGEYKSRFVSFESFFYGVWSYGGTGQFSTQVGIVQWTMLLASFFSTVHFYKKKDKLWIVSASVLAVFFFTLFLMTSASNIVWQAITTLQKFQFPWRFLTLSVFTTAILGGINFAIVPRRLQTVALIVFTLAIVLVNKDYWHAKDYLLKAEGFFTGVYHSTTDTGESSPRWSIRFMEHEPRNRIEVIIGKAQIKELKRRVTAHQYIIEAQEKSRIRENTLFFPGWEVFVDGKTVDVQYQDPANRGLLTFFVENGRHDVQIRFRETKLRLFADVVSVGSLFFLVGLTTGVLWKRKR